MGTPCPLSSVSRGCSATQGAHQDAQTFKRLTLPLLSCAEERPGAGAESPGKPERPGSAKSGTLFPISADGKTCGSSERRSAAKSKESNKATTASGTMSAA